MVSAEDKGGFWAWLMAPERRGALLVTPAVAILFGDFQINLLKFKQDILEKRMDLIEELGDPEFEIENINAKVGQLNELENNLNQAFIETLIQINGTYDSKQWLNLLSKLSENWFFIKDNP